jgi:hypothetical protein
VVSFFQEVNEFVDFMKLDATEVTFYKHIGRQRPYHGKILRTMHNVDLTNLSRIVYVLSRFYLILLHIEQLNVKMWIV